MPFAGMVIVRNARVEDIAAMHDLRLSVRENSLSSPDRVTHASYLPYVAQGSAWVAEDGDRIAGFGALDIATRSVWALFVAPDAERSGIGTALHDRMIEWAKRREWDRLSLSTAPGTRAERFYAAAGWTRDGFTDDGELRFVRTLDNQGGASMHRGSCLCGAVSFTVEGELKPGDACHCTQCRRQSGHFWASTNVPREAITIRGEDRVSWFQSSERVRRGFCSVCGSVLFWDPIGKPVLAVALGAFDAPTGTELEMHIFVADKGDYYEIADGVPQRAGLEP